MFILTLRTDNPEAEIGLYDGHKQLTCSAWRAHRELAETFHLKLDGILKENDRGLQDIQGIVIYKGPGSFTGLRIGFSIANALADSLAVPVVSTTGKNDWVEQGINQLLSGKNDMIAQPIYGSAPKTTIAKK